MRTYGYAIDQALVTDIEPDEKVNARDERDQCGPTRIGRGQGIANQRKAIIEGLKQSVEAFSAAVEGAQPKDVMMLALVTHLDTMKDIGAQAKSNTTFQSHSRLPLKTVPPDARRGHDRTKSGEGR